MDLPPPQASTTQEASLGGCELLMSIEGVFQCNALLSFWPSDVYDRASSMHATGQKFGSSMFGKQLLLNLYTPPPPKEIYLSNNKPSIPRSNDNKRTSMALSTLWSPFSSLIPFSRAMQAVLDAETERLKAEDHSRLLRQEKLHGALLTCCLEVN